MKAHLLQRLKEYYKLERFNVVWISVFGVFLNLKYGWRPSLLLTYGIALIVLVLLAQGSNFVKCRLASGCVLLTAETMKQLELQLAGSQFIRVHKFYLVNLAYIERLSDNSLLVGTHKPPHR
jgi:hypothetical protein